MISAPQRTKILHIEDNPENRMLVRAILEDAGYTVIDAEDGLSGIAAAIREEPALILLDINLPSVDGYEVVSLLKSFPSLTKAPVIAVTAYAMDGDRQRTLVAGCDGYIQKPIDVDALPRQVADFLRGKRERVEKQEESLYLRELNQRLVYRLLTQVEELRRLNQHFVSRATQLEELHRVFQGITSDMGITVLLERLLPGLSRALGTASLAVELEDPSGVRVVAGGDSGKSHPSVLAGTGLEPADDWTEVGWTLPLAVRGRSLGVMVARQALPPGAKADEENLLKIVANQVAVAIENARLFEEARASLERLRRLTGFSHLVASSLDLQEVFDFVTQSVLDLLQGDLARLWVVDEEAGLLRLMALRVRPGVPAPEGTSTQFPLGQGLVGWVVQQKTKRISPNLLDDPLQVNKEWVRTWGYVSQIAVPLIAGERAFGALVVLTKAPRRWTGEEEELLQLFAADAASALQNARLYDDVTRKSSHLQALFDTARRAAASLDLSEILPQLVKSAAELIFADAGSIRLLDSSGTLLEAVAHHGLSPGFIGRGPLRVGQGVMGQVILDGQSAIVEDLGSDPRYVHKEEALAEGLRSMAVVPLRSRDRVVGVLSVYARAPRRFGEEEIALLSQFANLAAVAIENSRLYAETQERLRQTETLLSVSQTVGATLDLTEVLRRTTRELVRTLGADMGGAWIQSQSRDSFLPSAGYHVPKELLETFSSTPLSPDDPLIQELRRVKGPIYTSDSQGNPRFDHPFARLLPHKSLLLLPMVLKDELIGGVAIVWSRAAHQCAPDELRLAEGIARQAAIAIENAQLLEAERKARARQEAFAEIAKELAQESDFDRLFPLICERACQLVGVDSAVIALVERDEVVYRGSHGVDQPQILTQRRKLAESRLARVVQTKRTHVSPDMSADPHWRDSRVVTRLGYRAALEVPIILRGEVIGTLGALHRSARNFSAEDQTLLVSLASHAAIALDRTDLWQKIGARLRETQTLLAVSEAVGSTLDLTEMLRRVARMTALSLGADMVGAYLADPDQEALRPLAGYHVPKPLIEAFMKFPIPLKGHRFLEEAWERQHPIFSSDAEDDLRIDRETFERFPHRSVLFVPMVVKGQPIGGLFAVWWSQKRFFASDDLHLAEGISRQAALAIDNARLFASQQEEAEISGALLRVAEAIGGRYELDSVLETVVRITPQLLGVTRCGLFLMNSEGILLPTKACGLSEEHRHAFLALRGAPEIPEVVRAIEAQEPVMVEAATTDSRISRKVIAALDIRSMLIIPLLSGGRVLGTMAVDTPGFSHAFTPRQIAIARGIATQVAVAVDNARLFQETRARLKETETLLAVSQAANSTLDLTEIMRRVARMTALSLGADMAGAYLADPAQESLYPIAGYHVPKSLLEEFIKFPIRLRGHRILEEAWERRQPVWSSNVGADPRIDRESFARFPHRSNLFFPMIVRGEPVGGLFVTWWKEEHSFTPEELRVVEGISHQAAIALENGRLYEDIQRRRQAAEKLAELGRLISQSLDAEEVGGRIVESVSRLLAAREVALFRLVPESGELVAIADSGDGDDALGRNLVVPEGHGAIGLAARERCLVATPDLLSDPRLTLTPQMRVRPEESQCRAVLAVPLMVKGSVVGVLGVIDRVGRVFQKEEQAMAQAFADQAAIALENARLYKDVTEKATRLASLLETTERQMAELRQTQAQLIQSTKLAAIGELVAKIAHELNNPLTSVLGFSSYLAERVDPGDPIREELNLIQTEATRARDIVRDLLDFSRQREFTPEMTDLGSLLQQTVAMLRRQGVLRAIVVRELYAPDLPIVEVDGARIKQVVLNIINNALDAMPAGGSLTIRTGVSEGVVLIQFTDTGAGIAPEHLPKVFDPFFTTKPEVSGTGLGLSVSLGIVQSHGGTIEVESEAGLGSTFTVKLPVNRGPRGEGGGPPAPSPQGPGGGER